MYYPKQFCTLSAALIPYLLGFTQVAKYEAGINAGAFIYQGDLTSSSLGSFKTPAFVWGFNVSRSLKNNLSVRLDVSVGRLKGNDTLYGPAWRKERAFAFSASAKEATVSLVYTPWTATRIAPYVFAGAVSPF